MNFTDINTENEMLLVANIIFFKDVRKEVLLTVNNDDFLFPVHSHICNTVKYLVQQNIEFDKDVIISYGKSLGYNDIEFNYLSSLQEGYKEPSTSIQHHIKLLKFDRFKNIIKEKDFKKVLDTVSSSTYNVNELRNEIYQIYRKIVGFETGADFILQPLDTLTEGYKGILEERKSGIGFYQTGFYHLDKSMTEGFAPRKITTVAARPGCGKSSFVYEIARRLANNDTHVFIFTLEMDKYDIIDKYISAVTGIPIEILVKDVNSLTEDLQKTLSYELERLSKNPFLYISDKTNLSLDGIFSQVQKLKAALGIEYFIVIIDLFGQISDFNIDMSLAHQYEIKLDTTKNYVKEIGGHWILVNQINRSAERSTQQEIKKDKKLNIFRNRPAMSQLKNSGKWEEVSDNVFLLFRAKYYDESFEDDILEVILEKQRKGKQGTSVYFEFLPHIGRMMPTKKVPYDKRVSEFEDKLKRFKGESNE